MPTLRLHGAAGLPGRLRLGSPRAPAREMDLHSLHRAPCPGGTMMTLPPGFEQRPALLTAWPVTATGLYWMAVHGNLCLALRHPSNTGPSRRIIVQFVRALGQNLVENGVLTADELRQAQCLEIEAGGGR